MTYEKHVSAAPSRAHLCTDEGVISPEEIYTLSAALGFKIPLSFPSSKIAIKVYF